VSPLRASRDFRLLWTGELVSQIGSQFTVVALLVQVYDLTHSSAAVGLIGAVQLGPMVLVSMGFGPQIDRRDRRRLLIGAEFGLMAASTVLFVGALHRWRWSTAPRPSTPRSCRCRCRPAPR
jgi:MFS family permease